LGRGLVILALPFLVALFVVIVVVLVVLILIVEVVVIILVFIFFVIVIVLFFAVLMVVVVNAEGLLLVIGTDMAPILTTPTRDRFQHPALVRNAQPHHGPTPSQDSRSAAERRAPKTASGN